MLFGRRKNTVNLEKGKSLYYKYYGNTFGMWHELGSEYADCNVPKAIEAEWKKDILGKLEKEIDSAQGIYLQIAVGNYINLLHDEEWLMQFLKTRDTDTFTAIILCEQLKNMTRVIKDKKKSTRIRNFLDEFKTKLLNNPITVHETYKTAEFMRAYDFSDNNLKSRIEAI